MAYTYDDLYRITGDLMSNDPVTANNGMVGYTYDAVGNRQQRTSSITAIPMQNFTGQYDPDDRLTAGYTYDGDGSTLTDPTGKTYTYDSLDRLVSVTGTGLNENFVYDGDGNKVSQTVNSVTTNYLIDSNNLTGYAQVLEELQNGAVDVVYSYGLSRISQDQNLAPSTWRLSFFGYDGQGSVRYLTNATGTVTDTYDYDTFGDLINQTHVGAATPDEFFFDGEQLDGNTDFYNLRARWMNPGIGRFQSMDSYEGVSGNPKSLQKYIFAANDPSDKSDSSGNDFDFSGGMDAISSEITVKVGDLVLNNAPPGINFDGQDTMEGVIERLVYNETNSPTDLRSEFGTYQSNKTKIKDQILGIVGAINNQTRFDTDHFVYNFHRIQDVKDLDDYNAWKRAGSTVDVTSDYYGTSASKRLELRYHISLIKSIVYLLDKDQFIPNPPELSAQNAPVLNWFTHSKKSETIFVNDVDAPTVGPFTVRSKKINATAFLGTVLDNDYYTNPALSK